MQTLLNTIATRLNIASLNHMQQQVAQCCAPNLVVYSPTGSGKTLAFAIKVVQSLSHDAAGVQAVVISPSRELAAQTHRVLQAIATGHKVSLICGGHSTADEANTLAQAPAVIVATPGRLLDHARHSRVQLGTVAALVVDEHDKCLELGFDADMQALFSLMPALRLRILTSATELGELPPCKQLGEPTTLNFLAQVPSPTQRMTIVKATFDAVTPQALRQLLLALPPGKIIVFANFRDTVIELFDYLVQHNIEASAYHGALTQIDREKAVALFNNGSAPVLVTTDLGARGLDIEQVTHIVHYQLPDSPEAWTHRNGRTARVDNNGTVIVMAANGQQLPSYIKTQGIADLSPKSKDITGHNTTLFIPLGRKEKISRADVVGFLANQGHIEARLIGKIQIMDHYALAAVPHQEAKALVEALNSKRAKIKNQRARLSIARPTARPSRNKLA